MLQQVCENIHNYFIKERHENAYEIAGGVVSPLDFLKEGQRFLIVGSDLNDGVYTYHASGIMDDDDTEAAGLQDETFAGTICALAVPPAVVALSGEIKTWVVKNGEIVNSPYTSENVLGVYGYTKASGGTGAGGTVTWMDVYAGQLNRWRKVAFL
jgi:hypothetical protein